MQPGIFTAVLGKAEFWREDADRGGAPFRVRPAGAATAGAVLAMFDDFEPKAGVMGLPPADPDRRRNWVNREMSECVNVLAEKGRRVVGHACLTDIEPGRRAELSIMVHQDHRNRGIGSRMVELLVEVARRMGYRRIWVMVDRRNLPAVRLYHKSGFQVTASEGLEIEMELELESCPGR